MATGASAEKAVKEIRRETRRRFWPRKRSAPFSRACEARRNAGATEEVSGVLLATSSPGALRSWSREQRQDGGATPYS